MCQAAQGESGRVTRLTFANEIAELLAPNSNSAEKAQPTPSFFVSFGFKTTGDTGKAPVDVRFMSKNEVTLRLTCLRVNENRGGQKQVGKSRAG
jgi:hypothetical protein